LSELVGHAGSVNPNRRPVASDSHAGGKLLIGTEVGQIGSYPARRPPIGIRHPGGYGHHIREHDVESYGAGQLMKGSTISLMHRRQQP
jgi:hypothetical protein